MLSSDTKQESGPVARGIRTSSNQKRTAKVVTTSTSLTHRGSEWWGSTWKRMQCPRGSGRAQVLFLVEGEMKDGGGGLHKGHGS